ncbi:small ribosomal subunit protein uS14m-like [Watersipora subatra]|uniref:small ribosomal subunit protein uS14m-like n=1 Tax=Watersipora subatra TaxID=2589382 RepID=UPI00355B6AFE
MFRRICSSIATSVWSTSMNVEAVLTTQAVTGATVSVQQCRNRAGYANKWMKRDVKRRELSKQFNNERIRLNAIRKDDFLPRELKDLATHDIKQLPNDAYPTRIHKRCVMTSRPRGLVNRYRLSRIQWRLLADYNKLSGVTRSTW